MSNKDHQLIKSIKKSSSEIIPSILENESIGKHVEHPLDKDVIDSFKSFSTLRDDDEDFRIFYYLDEIKKSWKLIIEKSIKCLRYFDKREPFLDTETKHPIAYGVQDLSNYFEKYSDFESMLYGGGKYYRDHVVHVFRVWLLGIDCLLEENARYLQKINIQEGFQINSLEKLSIWSIISLTHDLGYPLEKSQEIIEKTKDMMRSFIVNPLLSMDLSFNGVQNTMNDFVLRFLSSKMHKISSICPKDNSPLCFNNKYVARLQPKYYFKFQKSLEQSKHGILSALIIYKLLLYFLESDYNINEDYQFEQEDARQFYIRREILRAVSSHTCSDIYHLNMLSFAFLLIIIDDSQEWGRKRISELYVKSSSKYTFKGIDTTFDCSTVTIKKSISEPEVEEVLNINSCTIRDKFELSQDIEALKSILINLFKQNNTYKEIFRDGQDTIRRNFVFTKESEIEFQQDTKTFNFTVKLVISNVDKSKLEIQTDAKEINKKNMETFLKDVYSKNQIIPMGENKYIISEK